MKENNASKAQAAAPEIGTAHRDMVVVVRVQSGYNIGRGYMVARRGDNNRLYFLAEEEARALASGRTVERDQIGRAVLPLFGALVVGGKYAELARLRKCHAVKMWAAGAAVQCARRDKYSADVRKAANAAATAQRGLLAAMLEGKQTADLQSAFVAANDYATRIKAANAPKIEKINKLERDLAALLWNGERSGADLWQEEGNANEATLEQTCKSGAQVWKEANEQRARDKENARKANEKERKSARKSARSK